MKIEDAIRNRIYELCDEKNLSINKLANYSILTQSTLDNIVNKDSKNPKILTLVKICLGLGISLSEFFNSDLFSDIDVEE